MKKTRDPYPITDVYFLEMNAVDAATVTVGDLCERLTNDFDTGWGFGGPVKEFIDDFKKKDASKYNSISFGNGADGGYSVYVGVDAKNRIKKIFADASVAEYIQHPKDRQSYISWWWDKEDYNNQFFGKLKENRIRLFDLNTKSGLLAVGDFGGPLRSLLGVNNDTLDENGDLNEIIELDYFKKDGIFQNSSPIFSVKFSYGLINKPESSSFSSSVIHKELKPHQQPINYSYTELFNNQLDENCYPTKYIFEDYLANEDESEHYKRWETNIKIKENLKLSGEYISSRLPKAIQILKKTVKNFIQRKF